MFKHLTPEKPINAPQPESKETSGKALCKAVYDNDFDQVKKIDKTMADFNQRNHHGVPLIFIAIGYKNDKIIRYFVENGADLSLKDNKNRTPADKAIDVKCEPSLILYLKNPIAAREDDAGNTALFYAIKDDYVEIVKAQLKANANVNHQNHKKQSPLWVATGLNNHVLIALLVKAGAYINQPDLEGEPPIFQTLVHQDLATIEFLIKNGVNLLLKNKDNFTVLEKSKQMACRKETVDYLENRTHAVLQNNLYAAINSNNLKELKNHEHLYQPLLNEKKHGMAPIHQAVEFSRKEIVSWLLKNGADVHARTDQNGDSPLHLAARRDADLEIVQILIKAGADVNQENDQKQRPMCLAVAYNKNPTTAEYLYQNNSDLNETELGAYEQMITRNNLLFSANQNSSTNTASSVPIRTPKIRFDL